MAAKLEVDRVERLLALLLIQQWMLVRDVLTPHRRRGRDRRPLTRPRHGFAPVTCAG
jgi:hypothetical protein